MHWEHCPFYSISKHEEKCIKFIIYYTESEEKGNTRLFKKKEASTFFFTNSNIFCINWKKMLEDVAFLGISELLSYCITTVSENWFTSVLHRVDQLPAKDNSTPFHRSSASPDFCLRNSIPDITPQVSCWIKVLGLGWTLHDVNLVGLEPRWWLLTGVFWVVFLLKKPMSRAFPLLQRDLLKYFDVSKLIHDPWCVINRPDSIIWETSPYHDAPTTHFWMTSLIELYTAITVKISLSINDSITWNGQHACHDCWVCWLLRLCYTAR